MCHLSMSRKRRRCTPRTRQWSRLPIGIVVVAVVVAAVVASPSSLSPSSTSVSSSRRRRYRRHVDVAHRRRRRRRVSRRRRRRCRRRRRRRRRQSSSSSYPSPQPSPYPSYPSSMSSYAVDKRTVSGTEAGGVHKLNQRCAAVASGSSLNTSSAAPTLCIRRSLSHFVHLVCLSKSRGTRTSVFPVGAHRDAVVGLVQEKARRAILAERAVKCGGGGAVAGQVVYAAEGAVRHVLERAGGVGHEAAHVDGSLYAVVHALAARCVAAVPARRGRDWWGSHNSKRKQERGRQRERNARESEGKGEEETERYTETGRQTDRERERRERPTDRETDGQTDRQTDERRERRRGCVRSSTAACTRQECSRVLQD
jgi:hypothetical protein